MSQLRAFLSIALSISMVVPAAAQVVEGPLTAPSLGVAVPVETAALAIPDAQPVSRALGAAPERLPDGNLSLGSLDRLQQPTVRLSRSIETGEASPESLSTSVSWDRAKARTGAVDAGPAQGLGASPAETWRAIPTWTKVVTGITLAVGITVGALYLHGKHKNDVWKNSKSAALVVEVEKARGESRVEDLHAIGDEAYSRRDRMSERIKEAESRGQKTVDDKTHDSLDKAKAYRAFDGMVGGRARLNENAVSKDPKTRMGEQLPSAWDSRVGELEQDALRSGFEGRLALGLSELNGEIGREEGRRNQIAGDLKDFDARVPSLFGGNMKMHSERAQADLKEFDKIESGPEEALFAGKTSAMRGRVSDRLYGESGEFRGHRDHRDKLTELHGRVQPALETAERVDQDLQDLEHHLHQRTYYLLIASQHEHDEEPCGKDEDGDEKTCEVDNSGMYKVMAANEASAAQASASAANAGIAALKPMIRQLREDQGIKDENLTFALIGTSAHSNGSGFFGVWGDLFLPSWASMFGNFSAESQASDARTKFAPALGGIRSVQSEIDSRTGQEAGWVDGRITTDVNGQMEKAKGQSW
jgi:hypothetical protein